MVFSFYRRAAMVWVLGGVLCASPLAMAERIAPAPQQSPFDPFIGEGVSLEGFMQRVVDPARQADFAGDGLDGGDIERKERKAAAQTRAGLVAEFFRYDLDANLIVTSEEWKQAEVSRRRDQMPDQLERLDGNGDGVVEWKEVLRAISVARGRDSEVERLRSYLELPAASDGHLTVAEVRTAAEAVFAIADSDASGVISTTEAQDFRKSHPYRSPRQNPQDVYCVLPEAPPKARVVLVGAYQGARLPDQKERAGLTVVHVEPGREPLYLVLTTYEPVKWRFDGATARLSRVVVLNADSRDAVSSTEGAPANVTLLRRARGCINHFHDLASDNAQFARNALSQALGRPADTVFGGYELKEVFLPSTNVPAP